MESYGESPESKVQGVGPSVGPGNDSPLSGVFYHPHHPHQLALRNVMDCDFSEPTASQENSVLACLSASACTGCPQIPQAFPDLIPAHCFLPPCQYPSAATWLFTPHPDMLTPSP
jgi:hypothetical protein